MVWTLDCISTDSVQGAAHAGASAVTAADPVALENMHAGKSMRGVIVFDWGRADR